MTPDTPWFIAILTKLCIAARVIRLVEEGDRDWTLENTVRRVREELRPHFRPQDLTGRRVRIR